MDDFTTTSLIIADGSDFKPTNRAEADKIYRNHTIFMVYLLPAFILALCVLAEGWSWGLFGLLIVYVVTMRWIFKRP